MKRIILNAGIFAMFLALAVPVFGQGRDWHLEHAEYGAGNTWANVTPVVRSLIREHRLDMRVDNATLGGDPAPGSPKTLRLREVNDAGEERVLSFPEKTIVQISVSAQRRRDHEARAGEDGDAPLAITRATYGAEGHWFDVTGLLNSNIQSNRLVMAVNNSTMGGDPAYGFPKALRVWYSYRGRDFAVTVAENSTLALPADGGMAANGERFDSERQGDFGRDSNAAFVRRPRLRILRADYGADGRFADVTSLLAAQIQDGRLGMMVDNATMGGDPADNHRKALTVWYVADGRPAMETVGEGGMLSLPAEADFFQGRLRVMRAQYGADFRYFDVTDRLNSLIQNDQLNLTIDNSTMDGDPAPDQRKRLTVIYLFDGRVYRAVVDEHGPLDLPEGGAPLAENPSAALEILHATYGVEGQRVDVTDRVRAFVSGNRLEFQVSNGSLGGDPAPGRHKQLRVVYRWRGVRYEAVAGEGSTLAIP